MVKLIDHRTHLDTVLYNGTIFIPTDVSHFFDKTIISKQLNHITQKRTQAEQCKS